MAGLTERRRVDAAFCLSRVQEFETFACPNQVWIFFIDRWCQCDSVLCPVHCTCTWTYHTLDIPLYPWTIQQLMQWNHREANRVFTGKKKKLLVNKSNCLCDTKWLQAKLMMFISFFSNVWCGSHFYFRILVLMRVKIVGDGIFSQELFRLMTLSKLMTM